MKRALSLIIVLAMVLCMIPFSAFAADFGIAGKFVDGVITLVGTEEQTYLYTASEAGTLYIYAEPVTPVDENGEVIEDATVAEPYIKVDGADYTEAGIAVTAGQSYEITIMDDAGVGGDVTVRTNLIGLPGTESNPYDYYNPTSGLAPEDQAATTVSVEPGASVYYNVWYYNATTLRISGVGVKAVKVWEDKTIDGTEAGYVDFEIAAMERTVLIKITNKAETAQTYTFEGIVPSGTMNNPQVVTTGEYSVDIAENGEYWYQYVATAAGKLSIGVAATTTVTDEEGKESVVDCWQYTVNPMYGGETHYCNDEEIVNPETIDVVAGDKVVFVVATYSPTSRPAATVKTTVSFEEAVDGPIVIESLPYKATHSGEHEQVYSYTATEEGYLFVTSSDGDNGGFVNFNVWTGVEVYNGGWIYKMAADETVEVTVNTPSWGNTEVDYTYNFSWMTEVEPDGSSAFPFVIDTILPDGVTLTNDGEDAVYYSYVAEKNGEIYNGFWESATPVAAGESMNIYVPAGQSVNVYYLPPVAMIGDAEYTTIDAAVADAVSGDTITLVANATAEAGIVLPAGANLDLGAYDLVAPYLVAFAGSNVIGDVAEASITASNMSVGNVTIADVEYAWTATEGVYTLTAAGAVANAVAKIGDKEFATVEDALNAAVSGNTVTMIGDDINNADATLIIKAGVTLDIGAFDLAALNIVGFNGGYINASTIHATKDYGTIDVENMVLGEVAPAGTSAGYSLIPLLNGDKYVFAQVLLSQAKFDIINAGDTYELEFGFGITGAAKTAMLNNGASDNAVDVIVQASWKTENAELNQSFVYNDEFVGTASSDKKNLSASLGGILSKSDIKLFAKFVTDSGVVVSIPFENPTVVS